MRLSTLPRVCILAALLPLTPSTFERTLDLAKERPALADKISLLRGFLRDFPLDPRSQTARDHLITLLSASNHPKEALQEYRKKVTLRKPSKEPDLKLLELLLKAGGYSDVLRQTFQDPAPGNNFLFNEKLLELRVQAFLALGEYRNARQAVDQWLGKHQREGLDNDRFMLEIQTVQQLRRYLATLERLQGPKGKALFTAWVPDSLTRWSRRQEVPIVFFKLIPANPSSQVPPSQVEGRFKTAAAFQDLVEDMNRGFRYLSGNAFSLKFGGLHTLYVKASDQVAPGTQMNLLTSRVYIHTMSPLYHRAGQEFGVLVDCDAQAEQEAAYMGDGLIRITVTKLRTLTLMHEVLHGLGATHQEWDGLVREGYAFDPEDQGLMTFVKGELRYLGLEEKNRVLLDWPRVAVWHLPSETADLSTFPLPSPPSSN